MIRNVSILLLPTAMLLCTPQSSQDRLKCHIPGLLLMCGHALCMSV